MYTRPPDRPFRVPEQYSGNAFAREKNNDTIRSPADFSAFPGTGIAVPPQAAVAEEAGAPPSVLSSVNEDHVRVQNGFSVPDSPRLPLLSGTKSRTDEDLLLLGIFCLLSAERAFAADGGEHATRDRDEIDGVLLLIALLFFAG